MVWRILIIVWKKLGKTFKFQKELLKTEQNHDEVDGNNYKDKKDDGLPYVKQDVLCTAFSYARFSKAMEEITGFSMKDCLSLPGLRKKYFNSLRTEEDEAIYTNIDKYMRHFVRQSIKGGGVCSFNQIYILKPCDDIWEIISEILNVKGKTYDTSEVYLIYKNKHFNICEKEYENQYNDYRNEDEEEKEKYINEKTSQLPIRQLLKQKKLDELLWDFDAVSLYPSAMWDENSIYLRIETRCAFTPNMNKKLVKKFKTGNFTQGRAFSKIKYHNPGELVVHNLPSKEREEKVEIIRMQNGYIVDTLTSVEIQETGKIGGRVIEVLEGGIYREKFKVSPVRKVKDKLFALRQKYKDEGNDVMQLLVKILMNSLYAENIRKDIDAIFAFISGAWMMTEHDEQVKEYCKISGVNYFVKMIDDAGLEDEVKKINTIPLHLGAFILANSNEL